MNRIIVPAAALLLPAALAAQTPAPGDSARQGTTPTTRTATANATESAARTPPEAEMTPAMRAAQNNARVVGSAAWWRIHATADGQRRTTPLGTDAAPAPAAIPAPTTPRPANPPGGASSGGAQPTTPATPPR